MKHSAAIRTIGTTLALLACASMAIAGGSMALDESARAHEHAAAVHIPVQAAPRAEFTTGAAQTPAPPANDRHADKHEHGRTTARPSLRGNRVAPQRSKSSQHGTPATPGMGLLLRMGTSAGRELSLLLDGVTCAPGGIPAGRAPPRAAPHLTIARDPIACAADLRSALVTPPFALAGVTPPTHCTLERCSDNHPSGWTLARAIVATAPRTGSHVALSPERDPRSHAERFEGATA